MTDKDYTHIDILADRTGSMDENADGGKPPTKAELTTRGIRDLISDQKAVPGRVTFSLVQFDSYSIDRVAWFAPDIPADWHIAPRGLTPLLDATARAIIDTGRHLDGMAESTRPGRVIFVIGTDGQENNSQEYRPPKGWETVGAMITEQREKYGWDFVFIGADFDALAESGKMGIPAASSLQTVDVAMAAAYGATSSAMTRSRATGQSVSYTDDERKRASGEK